MHARSKRIHLFVYLSIALLAIAGVLAATTKGGKPETTPSFYAPHVPGEVLIKFKRTAGPSEKEHLRSQMALEHSKQFRSGVEHWRMRGKSTEQAIASLRGNPHVEYVEPNYILQAEIAPNDARYGELWGMNNTGQTGGTSGADIDAERAWNVSTGSHGVLVAVIDTGVDYNHPDLAANIWTNPGEIAGNGVDDDNNGFIDDIHGWDFSNNDNNPFDDNGHGTHCSGTIGAVGNNGIGVAGVSWNVSIMGVKFLGAGGSGSTAGAISSIEYATLMGVDIMSNSWGGGGFSQALLDAINDAAAQEIVFVAAAGNSNANNDTSPHYPSNYNAPNIIAVAATDDADAKASFSSYGATTVDLGAPGVDILSTLPGNAYGLLSGTSMATPHVSGAAALVRAVAPNTSAALVRQILMNLSDSVPSMQGITVSGKRLNAFFPIAEPDDVPPGQISDLAFASATSNSIFLDWTATGDDGLVGAASEYDLRWSTAPITDATFGSATRVLGVPAPGPSGAAQGTEVLGLAAGTDHYFAIKAKDEWGNIGPLSNVASGTTLPPPTFASSPASFSAALLTGQSTTRTLTIENAGVGTLDWSIPLPSVSGAVAVTQHEPIVLDKGAEDPRPGIPALEGFGGPDTFGYRWLDSDEPGGPVFSWTDIAMTGTPVAGLSDDDQNGGPIPIGFSFPFYGANFNAVRVSTNGWISFTSTSTAANSYSNAPLPNSGSPENLIAAFWDDLHFRGAQRATYANVGGNFVVQFTEVDTYTTGSTLTFQIELQPSGEIRLRYLNMAGTLTSATIGIQNAAKDDGLTVVHNSAYVHGGLEVRIAAVPQWLTASPTSGRLYAGESTDVTVTIDASGLDGGTYEGSVNVGSNDPLQPVAGHPVTLEVTGAPAIAVSPLAHDFGQIFVGFTGQTALTISNTGTDTLQVSSIVSGNPQVTVSQSALTVPAHSAATVDVTYAPTAPGTLSTTLVVSSDASNAATVTVDLSGSSVPAPAVLVNPTSFDETLFTGGSVARNLRVHNTGGSDLIVNMSVELGAATASQPPLPEPPKGDESDAGTGDNVIERAGGPDAFGYRFKDSDEAGGPTFNWVDISGSGTTISFPTPDDSISAAINLGMSFPFYGNDFSAFKVSTNGWLTFDTTYTGASLAGNGSLPSTSLPRNSIALFWDDLHLRTGNVKYLNDGTRFILQYTGVGRFTPSTGQTYSFQVQLYPSGRIVLQYLTMTGTLNSATIGIQNQTRTIALPISLNENYVHNNLAISIDRVPDWLQIAPASATIPPGGFRDFTATFNAGDSGDRVFQGAVRVGTNIPDPPFVLVPARLTVLGVADVATNPASVAFGTRFVGYPHLTQLAVRNVGTGALTVTDVSSNDPNLLVEEPPAAGGIFVIAPGTEVLYNLRWLPQTPGALNAVVTVYSDDPDEATLAVPVTGDAIPAPVLGYSPGSFSDALDVGEQSQHNLHLTNTGGSDLDFSIGVRLTDALVVPAEPVDLPKGVEPSTHGAPRIEGAGGPDMFGYHWKDSDEPGGPTFDWFDISSIGTPIAGLDGDDELSAAIPIGFSFPYYGSSFASLRVSTNGWLSFTSSVASGTFSYNNQQLPTGGTSYPENLLAPFWDDLDFRSAVRARYFGDGTRFIVQWTDVDHHSTTASEHYTFQVILYPSGRVVFQYLTMTGQLDTSTAGLQNATRDDGLTVAFNQAYIHDNLAIEIQSIADWLTVDQSSGTIPPGDSVDIPVRFNAADLVGGTYTGALRLLTNDPAQGLVELPATLVVTGFPAIAAAPPALGFGTVFVGVDSTLAVTIRNPGSDVLHVTNVAVSGDYAVDTTPFSLAVGGTRQLDVTFAPTIDGPRAGSIDFTSNATGTPLFSVPLSGTGLFPPVAVADAAMVAELEDVALPPGGSRTEPLRLYNNGQSDLIWTANVTIGPGGGAPPAQPEIQPTVELPKGDTSADGTGWHIERFGGPDAFGYRYRDSDEPGGPVFDWVDISSIGTPIANLDGDDETVGPLSLPFSFPYYGNTFNQFWASTNGWISFSAPSSSSLTNSPMPNTSGQPNQVAPFWDDLDFEGALHARTYYDGSRFIIQYTDVEHFPGGTFTSSYTFQIVLYPSGRIVFQYLSLSGNLISHSIGIQNQAENVGLGVTYNEDPPYVHEGLAVEFYTTPEWMTIAPTTGVIPAGGHADIDVMFDAAGLEDGSYDGTVSILNNDPFNSLITVPVTLHVGQVALDYIVVEPNTLNLSSSGNSVRAVLQLPEGLDAHDVVIESVSIGGTLYADPAPISYEDTNGDGVLELVVKFDRQAFLALVPEGDDVPVTVTGEVYDQTWFTGTDYVRAMHPRVVSPNGGNYLVAGHSTTLTWAAPPNGSPSAYDVWLSRDGGESWEVLASDLRSTQLPWSIDGPVTDRARIRVIAVDSRGVMGFDTSDTDFTIAGVLNPPAQLDDVLVSKSGESLTLHWKAPETSILHGPATSYRVLVSTEANGLFTELGTTTAVEFTTAIDASTPIRFYLVNAVNAAGETN